MQLIGVRDQTLLSHICAILKRRPSIPDSLSPDSEATRVFIPIPCRNGGTKVSHESADFESKVHSWQTRINDENGTNFDVAIRRRRSRKSSAPNSPNGAAAVWSVDLRVVHRPATSYGVMSCKIWICPEKYFCLS